MTIAVLMTDFLDLDIEKGKLTFSMGVPPGYFLLIPGLLFRF